VAVTYERPEGLSGINEAGGDDNDNNDGGQGERQGQEEAEGKEEMSILRHALHVRQPEELPSIIKAGGNGDDDDGGRGER
jgi:hypothetical protein